MPRRISARTTTLVPMSWTGVLLTHQLQRWVEVLHQQHEQSEQSRTAAEARFHEARGAWEKQRHDLEQQSRQQQRRSDELAERLQSQIASAERSRECGILKHRSRSPRGGTNSALQAPS